MSFRNVPKNAGHVTFSAGAAVYVGPKGQAFASLPRLGLLGENLELTLQTTKRQAKGGYPRVVVAESLLDFTPAFNMSVQEVNQDTLTSYLGLDNSDVTAATAVDVPVSAELLTFDTSGKAYTANPIKLGSVPVVQPVGGGTTYVVNTNYVIVRDAENRTMVQKVGAGIGATAQINYIWARPASRTYPFGQRVKPVEKSVRIFEEFDNGGSLEVLIYRCSIAPNGNLQLNSNSTDSAFAFPMTVTPLFDTVTQKLIEIVETPAV